MVSCAASNNPLSIEAPPAHYAAQKHRKTNSAPAILQSTGEHSSQINGYSRKRNEIKSVQKGGLVNGDRVTFRSSSPSSELSANDTLAYFSDTSSFTIRGVASTSIATRRFQFKEEFGTEEQDPTPSNKLGEQSPYTKDVYHSTTISAGAKPNNNKSRKVKKDKTKPRKKFARSCGPNLDFTYRNVYAAAAKTGAGSYTIASTNEAGELSGDGVSVVTSHVGCILM